VIPANLTRARLTLLLAASLRCGLLIGGTGALVAIPRWPALFGERQTAAPTLSSPTSPTSPTILPASDAPGEDLVALPRFPGSVRSDYEVALDDRYRLTVTEFLATAAVEEVRAFYQGVITAHGWERADIGFSDGEWSYSLADGDTLALIEIEQAGSLVEIDLQISEPLTVLTPDAAPAPPPPPPPPPGDDDDDD